MRWPWQSGDRAQHPTPKVAEERPSPAGWAFFPPLQRVIGDQQTLTSSDAFTRTLPAWGNPSFMGEMSHLVSTDGPSGVLDADGGGIGQPQATAHTPALSLRHPGAHPPDANSAHMDEADEPAAPSPTTAPIQRLLSIDGRTDTGPVEPATADPPLTLSPPTVRSVKATDESTDVPETSAVPVARSTADPRFNANATNDGAATIVSLPIARPLRSQPESHVSRLTADSVGTPRLGLGHPLPHGESANAIGASGAAVVQRDSTPDMLLLSLPTVAAGDSRNAGDGTGRPSHPSHPSQSPVPAVAPFTARQQSAMTLVGRSLAPGGRVSSPSPKTSGVLSAQRLLTAGIGALAGASPPSAVRPTSQVGVVQRAVALAPSVPASNVGSGNYAETLDDVSSASPAMVYLPTSAPAQHVITPQALQRDIGDLPLAMPNVSAAQAAATNAASQVSGAVASAKKAAAPVANEVEHVASAAQGAAPTLTGGGSAQDVDTLAEKLMIPLLRRFKSEMLLDRERRGLRTDAF